MARHHQDEETSSLLAPSADAIGTFAELETAFAQLAESAGASAIDEVWIVCKHATPSWNQRANALDRLACQRVCGGIVHIEAVFRNRATSAMIAYTVDKHDPERPFSGFVRAVAPDPRETYPSPPWSCHLISTLTPAERYGMLAYMQRQVDKPFNMGMYWNFLPVVGALLAGESQPEESRYFCSQLVASALRWIRPRKYADLEPRRCTPAMLVALLADEQSTVVSLFRPPDTLEL